MEETASDQRVYVFLDIRREGEGACGDAIG